MAISYATITGRITQPGTDIGIRARITARPLTTAGALKFSAEDRITWGPQIVETDDTGALPALQIPLGSDAGASVVWRFDAEPLDKVPGMPSRWTVVESEITASASLADLANVDLAALSSGAVETIAGYASTAQTAAAAAQAVGASTDAQMASRATDPASAFSGALKASIAQVAAWARNPDQLISGTVTRDANGAATSAPVTWPDGSPGTYTADALSTAFPGAVDGYHITYGSPVTKTYTQPTLTRDTNGAAVNVPAIVVS